MVINKKEVTYRTLQKVLFFVTVFVGTVFVSSITASHVIIELSIILPAYLPFLQLHVAAF